MHRISGIYEMTAEEREEIDYHAKYHNKGEQLSPIAYQALYILSRLYAGLHHCPDVLHRVKKGVWSNPHWFECTIDCELATWDFSKLTLLVILAHDMCVRVSIKGCGPRCMKLMFHPRKGREGRMSERHPTIEQAIVHVRGTEESNGFQS